jgi:hypothetical protein
LSNFYQRPLPFWAFLSTGMSRDFRPPFLSLINSTKGPDSRPKAVLQMTSCSCSCHEMGAEVRPWSGSSALN